MAVFPVSGRESIKEALPHPTGAHTPWSLRIPEAAGDQTLTRSQHTWPSLSSVAGGAL